MHRTYVKEFMSLQYSASHDASAIVSAHRTH